MKSRPFTALLLLVLLPINFLTLPAAAEETQTPPKDFPVEDPYAKRAPKVDAVADQLEYVKDEKKVIGRGNAVVRYENMHITADYAEVETETRKVYAKGHVIVFRAGKAVAQGDEIYFDFANQTGSFPDGRTIAFPWFIRGKDLAQVKKGVKVIKEGRISTCDLEKPHYDIRASTITVYDNDKMVARNVKIYVLNKPVFWWPFLVIPLQQRRNFPLAVNAGYNSRHGAYIETSKGFSVTEQVWGKYHIDWRSKRGAGGGADLDYDFGPKAQGHLKTYLTQDERAPTPGGENPFSELEDRERGRVTLLHRTDIDPYTNVILRYNRLADEVFLQDFFEKESRAEIEPQSFVTATKNSERYGLLIHAEKRMNSFESMVERLPEVRFDWKNQPLFSKWLYFESQASFANLATRLGRSSLHENALRFDQFNEWSAPKTWNQVHFTPFLNFRNTIYSREKDSPDQRWRTVWGGGLDVRTQYYKTFDASFDKAGIEINGIRHILEPLVEYRNWTSTVSDEQLSRFDSLDRIDDANIVTLGVENRLQTKRVINGRMQRVDFVSMNTYLSYEMHPDGRSIASQIYAPFDEEGRTASNFTILGKEIVLRPYEWLQFEGRFDYDMERDQFRVFNQDILLRRSRLKLLFGHRFIRDIQDIEGSNQFIFESYWTLNDLWTLGGYIRWDAAQGSLDEWQLSASRDLHDFILDFGYNVRNSDIETSNKELFFNFRMKAFPEITVRSGRQASFSEPRIGETVAGANQSPLATTYQLRETTY